MAAGRSLKAKDLQNYQRGETSIKPETLAEVGAALTRVPDGFDLHKTVGRQLEAKAADVRHRQGLRLGHRRGAGLRLAR